MRIAGGSPLPALSELQMRCDSAGTKLGLPMLGFPHRGGLAATDLPADHGGQALSIGKRNPYVCRRVGQLPGVGRPELLRFGSVKGSALVPGRDQLGPAAVERE